MWCGIILYKQYTPKIPKVPEYHPTKHETVSKNPELLSCVQGLGLHLLCLQWGYPLWEGPSCGQFHPPYPVVRGSGRHWAWQGGVQEKCYILGSIMMHHDPSILGLIISELENKTHIKISQVWHFEISAPVIDWQPFGIVHQALSLQWSWVLNLHRTWQLRVQAISQNQLVKRPPKHRPMAKGQWQSQGTRVRHPQSGSQEPWGWESATPVIQSR